MSKEIPPLVYFAMQRMTEDDLNRNKIGMTESEIKRVDELAEITGHHKPDYESEVPFESNYNDGNEDWLEP